MSSDNPPPAPKDQFAGTMGSAVNNAFSGIQNFSNQPNIPQQTYGTAAGAFGGNTFGNSGYNPADTVQAGNWMTGQAQAMSPYVTQMFNMGFDPQNEYYGRAAHNVEQQARASQGARGLQMTPYGAGLEDSAMGNFNLDWENQRLGRASQGLQAGGNLMGQINQGVQGGQNMAQSAGTWQSNIAQMLSQLGLAGQQQPQMAIQDWLNYTNQGSTSANNRFQGQMAGYQAQQASDAAMWQGIGQLAGAAGSAAMFSDRNIKYDITPIDDMLVDRLEETPIPSWRYAWETVDMPKHIGPMAQDLKHNFGIGTGRQYMPVDGIGLSLAVAKVLAKKVRRLERRAA